MPGWVDLSIALVFAGALLLEFRRGFGRAVFDLAALLVAMRATWMLNDPMSNSVHLVLDHSANHAVMYFGGFLVIGALLVVLGRLLHSTTLVSTDVFEPMLGGVCGLAIATIVSHALVQGLALGAGTNAIPESVANSAMGMEFLRFGTYHQVLEFLYNFHREPVG